MKSCVLFCFALVTSLTFIQVAEAQPVPVSDKAVFYNFDVIKCSNNACPTPYQVSLESVRTVKGSFKGINNRISTIQEPGNFLIRVFEKRSGKMQWETVVPNPVAVNIEYDGHAHGDNNGCSLQRKTIEHEQGSIAVRLPFEPDECVISVSLIDTPDKITELATF